MLDENQTQNDINAVKTDENTEKTAENKVIPDVPVVEKVSEMPKIEQKEPEMIIPAEAETTEKVVVEPQNEVFEVENVVVEENLVSAEPKL